MCALLARPRKASALLPIAENTFGSAESACHRLIVAGEVLERRSVARHARVRRGLRAQRCGTHWRCCAKLLKADALDKIAANACGCPASAANAFEWAAIAGSALRLACERRECRAVGRDRRDRGIRYPGRLQLMSGRSSAVDRSGKRLRLAGKRLERRRIGSDRAEHAPDPWRAPASPLLSLASCWKAAALLAIRASAAALDAASRKALALDARLAKAAGLAAIAASACGWEASACIACGMAGDRVHQRSACLVRLRRQSGRIMRRLGDAGEGVAVLAAALRTPSGWTSVPPSPAAVRPKPGSPGSRRARGSSDHGP